MPQGSIARDTLAVCGATILFVLLLLAASLLWDRAPGSPVRPRPSRAAELPDPLPPAPYII